MQIVKFSEGDTLILKKKHPCGAEAFTVLRGGSDVKIQCISCAREMTLERIKLEKSIKRVIPKNSTTKTE